MSIINQFFFEKLIDGCVKTPLSLKEQTLTKVAIHLCQYSDLKKFILGTPSPASRTVWDDLIVKQSFAMCEDLYLPPPLISLLIRRIRLIAIRLLAWNKEHEIRLKMTPIVCDQFLFSSDWTMEGKVNERKVAERLVQNEEISITDRYRLACLNCLEPYILSLWNQISLEDRRSLCNRDYSRQINLVRLWSYHLTEKSDLPIEPNSLFWQRMFVESVNTGQRTSVTYCWGILNESQKQRTIVNAALSAISEYCKLRSKCEDFHLRDSSNKIFEYWEEKLWVRKVWRAMPEHYGDILYFLLSQMCEDQMFAFFENISSERIFECLLQYPNVDYFVPFITKLWGILPNRHYDALLITVVDRFTDTECCNDKNLVGYDYGRLLIELLDAAPECYKRYIFSTAEDCNPFFGGIRLILVKIFQNKSCHCRNVYIEVIQHILKEATVEEKRSLLLSSCGSKLCEYFIENSFREILDSILSDVFSEEKLKAFKKNFFLSSGKDLCLRFLVERDEEYVDSLLHWGNLSETEISDFRSSIFNTMYPPSEIVPLLENLKMDCLERIMKYCLPTEANRRRFKFSLLKFHSKYICIKFVKSSQREDLQVFLAWAFPSDDLLFRSIFVQDICRSVLRDLMAGGQCEDVDNFSKWCGLSPEEIDALKADVIQNNESALFNFLCCGDTRAISFYLKWGLLDVESARACKIKMDKYISEAFTDPDYMGKCFVKTTWDQLMEYRLSVLRNEQADNSQNVKRGRFLDNNRLPKKLKKQ